MTGQISSFQADMATALYIKNYAYGLGVFNFKHFAYDATYLKNQKFYSYIEQPTVWKLSGQNVEIDTYQFLGQVAYLIGDMLR